VILTGYLDDGASGLYAIKERGGLAVVQTPEDAEVPDMPLNALRRVQADEIVPLNQIVHSLTYLVAESLADSGGIAVSEDEVKKNEIKRMEIEVGIAREDYAIGKDILTLGEPSLFACPECHGVLLKIKEGVSTRFRCHTGHAYSLDTLLAEISQSVEESLWNSLRAIEETELLLDHMAAHLRESSDADALTFVEQKVQESKRQQQLVRQALMKHRNLSGDQIEDGVRPQGEAQKG
jgi:two-component system chemotaxis response regulator CheB